MSASELAPEQIEEYWFELLSEQIIEAVYERLEDHRDLKRYAGVVEFFKQPTARRRQIAPRRAGRRLEDLAEGLLYAAMRDVVAYAKDHQLRIVVSLDNFEKYPIRMFEFEATLQGFVRAVAHFSRHLPERSDHISIVFAFPEEIERIVSTTEAAYANVLKDTHRSSRIRWSPGDLWSVALHRYRLFLHLNDPPSFKLVQDLDLYTKDGRRKFLSTLFKGHVRNGRGLTEDPASYIIRHTQLLPRHLIALLNEIVRLGLATGNTLHIPADIVFDGVGLREDDIAMDILTPYTWIFPDFVANLKPVLGELTPSFHYRELDKRMRRFKLDDGLPFDMHERTQIWEILFGMGIIGLEKERDERAGYIKGVFHFNTSGVSNSEFLINSQANYCFHPLFSRHYGIHGAGSSSLCVFPAGVESIGGDGRRLRYGEGGRVLG